MRNKHLRRKLHSNEHGRNFETTKERKKIFSSPQNNTYLNVHSAQKQLFQCTKKHSIVGYCRVFFYFDEKSDPFQINV